MNDWGRRALVYVPLGGFLGLLGYAWARSSGERIRSIPGYVDEAALRAINETPMESVEWGFLTGEVFTNVSDEGLKYRLKFEDEEKRPLAGLSLTDRHNRSKPTMKEGRITYFRGENANEAYSEALGETGPDGVLALRFAIIFRGSALKARNGFGWMQLVALFHDFPCRGLNYQALELPAGFAFLMPDGSLRRRVTHYFAVSDGELQSGLFDVQDDTFHAPFDGVFRVRRLKDGGPNSNAGPSSRMLIVP